LTSTHTTPPRRAPKAGIDPDRSRSWLRRAWPIVELHVKYVHAARFGERLAVQASLVEWQSRLAVNYLITNAATEERVARARTVQVAVEASTGVLQFATPAALLERVAAATKREETKWNDAM